MTERQTDIEQARKRLDAALSGEEVEPTAGIEKVTVPDLDIDIDADELPEPLASSLAGLEAALDDLAEALAERHERASQIAAREAELEAVRAEYEAVEAQLSRLETAKFGRTYP